MRKPDSREAGQSTIEFALTLILLMSFTMFFLRLSLMFGFGNYVHYATFMAARAYLAAGADGTQEKRAEQVILAMLKKSVNTPGVDKFPMIAKGHGGGNVPGLAFDHERYEPGNPALSWMRGVRYTFRSRLFLIPFGGAGSVGNLNEIELTSESWLGREPSYSECQGEMSKMRADWDNGC